MIKCIICKEAKSQFVIIDAGNGQGLCTDCYRYFRELERSDSTTEIIKKYYSDILPIILWLYENRGK